MRIYVLSRKLSVEVGFDTIMYPVALDLASLPR
jgi:hypothetical protein